MQAVFLLPRNAHDVAPRFADRPGGYTRIVRVGDGARVVIIELIGSELKKKEKASS